jgi:hypothetical protein
VGEEGVGGGDVGDEDSGRVEVVHVTFSLCRVVD